MSKQNTQMIQRQKVIDTQTQTLVKGVVNVERYNLLDKMNFILNAFTPKTSSGKKDELYNHNPQNTLEHVSFDKKRQKTRSSKGRGSSASLCSCHTHSLSHFISLLLLLTNFCLRLEVWKNSFACVVEWKTEREGERGMQGDKRGSKTKVAGDVSPLSQSTLSGRFPYSSFKSISLLLTNFE